MKVVKKRKAINAKVEKGKVYSLEQATALVKDVNTTTITNKIFFMLFCSV